MRARRRKPKDEDQSTEDWLVTYADAITLLMAFFVMLVSFSKIELPVFEQVQAGIAEQIGGTTSQSTPFFALEANLRDILTEQSIFPPDKVNVSFDDNGVVVDFAAGYFFEPGTANLKPIGVELLRAVRGQLEEEPFDAFKVTVEGHTSDLDPANPAFETNWELSAAQAARVVRELIALEMAPHWLSALAFADTQPKVKNRDIAGNPIAENRAKNERIALILHP